MRTRINGEERSIPEGATVTEVLERLGIDARHVAVEHNRQLLEEERWGDVIVGEGDELEIVRFVGGG